MCNEDLYDENKRVIKTMIEKGKSFGQILLYIMSDFGTNIAWETVYDFIEFYRKLKRSN